MNLVHRATIVCTHPSSASFRFVRTSMILTLPTTTSYTGSNNDITLLGFVSESMSLVRTCGTVAGHNVGTLTIFPCSDTQQETQGIRLFVTPQFFQILVRSHDDVWLVWCSVQLRQGREETTRQEGAFAVVSFVVGGPP